MTQEELDALMQSDIDSIQDEEDISDEKENEESDEEIIPPPADDKNKVVAQLDEVTKESEEKASEVVEIMEKILDRISMSEENLEKISDFLERQENLFTKLSEKFPHIKTFKDELEEIENIKNALKSVIGNTAENQEELMNAMMAMQYQDIHRQKIERVINIMRALIKYMNKLFEGKIEDENRVKSATHIHGDKNEELVNEDDIEALIAQFAGAK